MKYPLIKLTECLLKHKKKLAKGIVTREIQKELSAALDINCSAQLECISTERYDLQCLHETSYHYSVDIGNNESMIRFTVAMLRNGEETIETKLLFKDLDTVGIKRTGIVNKDAYLR